VLNRHHFASGHCGRRQQTPRLRWRFIPALLFVLFCGNVCSAIPLSEYHKRVQKALDALDLLTEKEEGQTDLQRVAFVAANVRTAREALPRSEKVEWNGTSYDVNNSWLDEELKEFERLSNGDPDRAHVLDRILERLKGIEERLEEIDRPGSAATASQAEMKQRLAAILQRSEYARQPQGESALGRLALRFLKWLSSLLPKPPQLSPGRAVTVSRTAQIIVVLIALAVIAYAVSLFAPRFLRNRRPKKKAKPEARVVLGERLEPEQSAVDLLADAEALARAGDLRGAIRRGYIALLVELGDRKIISLAQHKTNRDYLRAVRSIEALHRNMEKLTNSFEAHWYGLAPASKNEWLAFRADYKEALSST
jgi:Na+-transporting methylmalonyl-CoA/oxaloacetate decarboxylase gamma subunit